jgi:hypothetical protein
MGFRAMPRPYWIDYRVTRNLSGDENWSRRRTEFNRPTFATAAEAQGAHADLAAIAKPGERNVSIEDARIFSKDFLSRLRHWMKAEGYKFRWDRRYGFVSVRRRDLPGRQFRILLHLDLFQICDGNFDRWANSTGAQVRIPRTRDELRMSLPLLVDLSAWKERFRDVFIRSNSPMPVAGLREFGYPPTREAINDRHAPVPTATAS